LAAAGAQRGSQHHDCEQPPDRSRALHDVAQRASGAKLLGEALLELDSGNLLSDVIKIDLVDDSVTEQTVGGKIVYKTIHQSHEHFLPDKPTALSKGHQVPSQKAAAEFRVKLDLLHPTESVTWPKPKILELYAFALWEASHVHFTFLAGEEIPATLPL
jgi:hypothetical protein